jgi:hypothetical protein
MPSFFAPLMLRFFSLVAAGRDVMDKTFTLTAGDVVRVGSYRLVVKEVKSNDVEFMLLADSECSACAEGGKKRKCLICHAKEILCDECIETSTCIKCACVKWGNA